MIKLIEQRLQEAFSPTSLHVLDESEKHKGHAGALQGGGHFAVSIQADCFKSLSRVEMHRKIYQVLGDLIPEKIHALSILSL